MRIREAVEAAYVWLLRAPLSQDEPLQMGLIKALFDSYFIIVIKIMNGLIIIWIMNFNNLDNLDPRL